MIDTAFVYCLDFSNGKQYVGVSSNPSRRYSEHRGSNTPCGHAFRKHGNPRLRVLVKSSREYCMELEAKLTDEWRTIAPSGYNLQRGGIGGSIPSAESREKMRQAQMGKKRTEADRAKMRKAQQNRPPISEETRARLSEAAKKRGMLRSTIEAAAMVNRRLQSVERRQAHSARMRTWWASRKQGVLP